jgi:hypothetical protein
MMNEVHRYHGKLCIYAQFIYIYIYICALCRHPSQNLPHLYTISQVDTTTKCNVGGDPNPPTCSLLVRENGSSWYIL